MREEHLWKAKLAAWTHDPTEKALVLLRDPLGHEGGTVTELRRTLFGGAGVSSEIERLVEHADHWASAADRPQFPRTSDGRFVDWAQVRFTEQPVLVHPLSGRAYDLQTLKDVHFMEARAVSFDHFNKLIVRNERGIDYRRTFLAFWRNGPVSPHRALGVLWGVLPADTRVPDHAIWDHLQLTSALAGAMAFDREGRVALMAVSLGPVQSFIEQGRSTSDLWAGSHLLARLSWEALRPVCERFGPDSVIFPHLNGVPLVDLWLREQGVGVEDAELEQLTDANPAFVASLPNRFVAIVPEDAVLELAEQVERGIRDWVRLQGQCVARRLVERTGTANPDQAYDRLLAQIQRQLGNFPEIHWAAVPWRLAGSGSKVEADELARIERILVEGIPEGGLLGTPAWGVLSGEIEIEGTRFYRPNPGVLYPDLYQLLDRLLAATKATRTFDGMCERGYRCSLCGEREWLTDDETLLMKPRSQRGETLWTRVGARYPSWSRKGEHLCGICALKRLWPGLFADELARRLDPASSLGEVFASKLQRFVVSTHTMAMAPTLDRMIDVLSGQLSAEQLEKFRDLRQEIEDRGVDEFVSLPKRIANRLVATRNENPEIERTIRGVPALLDRLAEKDDEEGEEQARVRASIRCLAGAPPERYYALVLLDGDHMGGWLSGSHSETRTTFGESWHPAVRAGLQPGSIQASLAPYLKALRPPSPARHAFISRALNGFAIHLARLIVEERYNGKLLYAGGDDVLAMVAIDDLLHVLMELRCAYSGIALKDDVELKNLPGRSQCGPDIQAGGDHVLLTRSGRRTLLRMMGTKATLSAGSVIAHHSAPLGVVLRELRAAERHAKAADGGNRDAFSVTLMKRAGGMSRFTAKWFRGQGNARTATDGKEGSDIQEVGAPLTSIGLLLELRDAFARHLSRRAAFYLNEWLDAIGSGASQDQLVALLGYQFARQAKEDNLKRGIFQPSQLAQRVVRVANACGPNAVQFIREALTLAEFLAREGRTGPGAGV